jgi:hypothetical protein
MFKWFDKWLAKRARNGMQHLNNEEDGNDMLVCETDGHDRLHRRNHKTSMNFTIYSANGGHVLEYSEYDERKDENINTLHLIPGDKDLGQSIAHVITLEMLRK